MKAAIIIIIVLQYLTGFSQPSVRTDTVSNSDKEKTIKEILNESININDETFDLKFLIRILLDHGWYLKLNKDATFEYIHWSGWEKDEGTVIEKGKYSVANNVIKFKSEKRNSELPSKKYFIVAAHANGTDNDKHIGCAESDAKIYCIYQK